MPIPTISVKLIWSMYRSIKIIIFKTIKGERKGELNEGEIKGRDVGF